jgi:hypothetical protein
MKEIQESQLQEELIYFVCENILGRGKEKGRIKQKRWWKR